MLFLCIILFSHIYLNQVTVYVKIKFIGRQSTFELVKKLLHNLQYFTIYKS